MFAYNYCQKKHSLKILKEKESNVYPVEEIKTTTMYDICK